MSFIERTWGCQNTACGQAFIAHVRYPVCPHCGCVRVAWVPTKVNVGKVAGGVDSELRTLADLYGLSDLNSPSPSRQPQAKKLTPAPSGGDPMVFQGFAAKVDPAAGAQCVPTANRIEAKITAGVGQALTGQFGVPSIARNTQLVGTYRAGDK